MKKFLNEFKEFAMRGNVIDMAVGVIIGGAFGKIVTSLVEDIAMPAISVLLGTVNFADLSVVVSALNAPEGSPPIEIKYGVFLQNTFNFLIISLCVFLAVKIMNATRKQLEPQPAPPEPETPAEPSAEELLLTEIRDVLKSR